VFDTVSQFSTLDCWCEEKKHQSH